MKTSTIEKILNFLKEKEGKEIPQNWNLIEKLETHPDDTQYRYEGDLDLMGTNIKKLPDKLHVNGSLSLSGCKQLTELPNKLHVGRFLYLNDSSITELPKKLFVGGSLDLNKTNITKLPDNLFVDGWLDITYCKQLTKLPNNLDVKRDLYLDNSSIMEIPNNLYVGDDLFINNTPLADKYTDDEIRKIVASTGGKIIGNIFR